MSTSRVHVEHSPDGLRLVTAGTRRALGDPDLTWAELLSQQLSNVLVYALYFPSRFDLPVDATVTEALATFGRHTGPGTSVNRWDPTDPHFSQALALFDLEAPPALVLTRGHIGSPVEGVDEQDAAERQRADGDQRYLIALTDQTVLGNRDQLVAAINVSHEVLMRADPAEMTHYLRERQAHQILTLIGKVGSGLQAIIVKFKPTFMLPGGFSIQLGQ